NIPDLADQPDVVITIFDRYGKLIKMIKPSGAGWDGNFDGTALPSSDYWFRATYTQNGVIEEFKAHFTLKR
ncbi:MAG TPA: T9SS type B sorting domain-containing protein, partial [Flavobacterium sp.]|nr:T9SS type B sorting domain-containing protein [Flavobacterium sp.]